MPLEMHVYIYHSKTLTKQRDNLNFDITIETMEEPLLSLLGNLLTISYLTKIHFQRMACTVWL